MNRAAKINFRFRIYLAVMGAMAFALLFFLLKDSLTIQNSEATESVDTIAYTEGTAPAALNTAAAQKLLPFRWARTVRAGERLSTDMFILMEGAVNGESAEPSEVELNEQLLMLSGRYLIKDQLAGMQIDRSLLSDDIPLKASKGSLSTWIKMSEKHSHVFANYVLGNFVSAVVSNAFEASTSIPPGLDQLRILALDQAENALCLELSAQQHMLILSQTERAAMIFVPTTEISKISSQTTESLPEPSHSSTELVSTPTSTTETMATNSAAEPTEVAVLPAPDPALVEDVVAGTAAASP